MLRAKISAVPPEFPFGHLKAVTGTPGLPYSSSKSLLRSDHLHNSLCPFTNRTLSKRQFVTEPLHLRISRGNLPHFSVGVNFEFQKMTIFS